MQVDWQRLGLQYVRAVGRLPRLRHNPGMTKHEGRQRIMLEAALRGVHRSHAEQAALDWLAGQSPSVVRELAAVIARARAARSPLDALTHIPRPAVPGTPEFPAETLARHGLG
jgi:hypothetical protein